MGSGKEENSFLNPKTSESSSADESVERAATGEFAEPTNFYKKVETRVIVDQGKV